MPEVNRDWNVWCSISGSDPGDKDQMKSFNFDRRVAQLAGHEAEVVREAAVDSWRANPGRTMSAFLDLWLAEVNVRIGVGEPEVVTADQPIADVVSTVGEVHEKKQHRDVLGGGSLLDRVVAELDSRRQEFEALRWEREAEKRRVAEILRASSQRVRHLYNITSLDNLASIMSSGILCHDAVNQLSHVDMADAGVQDRRASKSVQGVPLHSYASLYFNPRNAMLFRLLNEFPAVVVLRVSSEVLGIPGVVVTDGNAASRRTKTGWRQTESWDWTLSGFTRESGRARTT